MSKVVKWMIAYGVDRTHVTESTGKLYSKLKDAKSVFKSIKIDSIYKIIRLIRIEFGSEYKPASRVDVLQEKEL